MGVTLSYLHVRKYRDLEKGKIVFAPTQNILLGKNASGKTTLLRLIAGAVSGDLRPFAQEPYDFEWRLDSRDGYATIRAVTRPRPIKSKVGPLGLPSDQWRLQVKYHIKVEEESAAFEITAETDAGVTFNVTRPAGLQLSTEKIPVEPTMSIWDIVVGMFVHFFADDSAPIVPFLKYITIVGDGVRRFDESLDTFERQFGQEIQSEQGASEHLNSSTTIVIDTADGTRGGSTQYTPPEILQHAKKLLGEEASSKDDILVEHRDLPFLKSVVSAFGYDSAAFRADVRRGFASGTVSSYVLHNYRIFFRRRDGSTITEQELSYGQKRLLAYFFELHGGQGPFVADELVNGLHHEWIALCMNALVGRQSFMTSQNPLLLDCLTFDSPEDVRKTFVVCESSFDDDAVLRWHNMSDEDARHFFSSYKVGIQHVAEILRTKGLW